MYTEDCIQLYQNPATAKECLVGFIALSSAILQTHFQMVLVATERYLSSRGTVTSLRYCNVGVQVTYMALSWLFCVAYITTTSLYHSKTYGIICGKGGFNWFKDSKSTLITVIPIIPCLMLVIVFYILTNKNILKSSKRIFDAISASSRTILNERQNQGENRIQCEKTHPDDRNGRKQITIQQQHCNNIVKVSSKQKQLHPGKTHVIRSLKMDLCGKKANNKERSASITYIKEADISYDFTSPRQQTSDKKCSRVSSNLDINDARLYTIPTGHSWHAQPIKSATKTTKTTVFANKWASQAFITSCLILFVLLWTYIPFLALVVIENIVGYSEFDGRVAFIVLPLVSSALNPVIYLWRIPEFRLLVTQKFKCRRSV